MRASLLKHVVRVSPAGGHRVHLRFEDGVEGEIDLRTVIRGFRGALAPLEDPAFVAQVAVNEVGTLGWPNGLELDPIVLYCATKGIPLPTWRVRRARPRRARGKKARRSGAVGAAKLAGRSRPGLRSAKARRARKAG